MNILILGNGGREHAFAWKISQSLHCSQLYIAPGNAGTAEHGTNINISVNDFEKIKSLVTEKKISLVVVGPEEPLVRGIVDFFRDQPELQAVAIIGPDQHGAQLEGSKHFAKVFMQKYGIPTARFKSFTALNIEEGNSFLDTLKPPYVIKASGLAAGKGVLIIDNKEDAKKELYEILYKDKFEDAGKQVVIEEFLDGIECSAFVLTDGKNYCMLPYAKDYKRIGEGDTGPNTGGMGAVSPVAFADDAFRKKVEEQIVKPTITGIQKEKINYKGFVFIGLMNVDGNPYVIEYNCRMGDPETEVVLPRIKNDFVELLLSTANESLGFSAIEEDHRLAVTVVMVSGGYPAHYEKGYEIRGLDRIEDSIVFHAGTTMQDNKIITSGGRVLSITSMDDSLSGALAKSYDAIKYIHFDYEYYRKDVGQDLMKLEKTH